MTNAEIAAVFLDIAALLRARRDSIFKIRAYEKAAKSIEQLETDLTQLASEGRLKEIPGVGEAINKKIIEMVETGRLEYYDRLKAEVAGKQTQS